jgi:hypothetical protein
MNQPVVAGRPEDWLVAGFEQLSVSSQKDALAVGLAIVPQFNNKEYGLAGTLEGKSSSFY